MHNESTDRPMMIQTCNEGVGIMNANRLATDTEKARAWDSLMSSTQSSDEGIMHACLILVDAVTYRTTRDDHPGDTI